MTQQFLSNPFYSLPAHSVREFSSKFSDFNHWLFQHLISNQETNKIHLQVSSGLDFAALGEAIVLGIFQNQYYNNLVQAKERFFQGLNSGSLVYDFQKDEVRVFRYKTQEEITFAPYPRNKNETLYTVNENRINDLLLLAGQNEHSHYTRNTKTYLHQYAQFIATFLNEERILSTFQKRTIIIANLSWVSQLAELNHLPIQVGEREKYLPIQPLIEVYNDKEVAFKVIRNNPTIQYDLVYVGNDVESIVNDATNYQGDGMINKLIFVTSCNLSKDYGFKKWAWTREETSVLKAQIIGTFESKLLASQALQDFKNSFAALSDELIAKGCDPAQTKGLINWLLAGYASHALVDKNAILERQIKELNDESEGILTALLYDAQIYDTALIKQQIFDLIENFQFVSGKSVCIENAIRNNDIKEVIVVAPKWQAELLKAHFQNQSKVKIITNTELRSILRGNSEGYLMNGVLFWKKRQVIIPHVSIDYQHSDGPLRYYQLYQLARQMGHVTLLFYEDIENNRARLFEVFDEHEHRYRLTHADRPFFVPTYHCEWPVVENQPENEIVEAENLIAIIEEVAVNPDQIADYQIKLNDYFSTYFGVWKNVKRLPKSLKMSGEDGETIEVKQSKIPVSKTKYRLWFDENDSEDWGENDLIGQKTTTGWKPTRVAELGAGAVILDFDITLDNAWEPLKTIPEAAESIKAVKWASKEWREWLKHSFQNYLVRLKCTEEVGLKTLTEKLGVDVDKASVKRWMNDRQTEYFFPRRIDDLDKVLDLRIRQTLPDNQSQMQEKAERIRASRGRSAGFREVITKLKVELTYWKLKEQKGAILSKMAEHFVTELMQREAPKTILKIEKLSSNPNLEIQ